MILAFWLKSTPPSCSRVYNFTFLAFWSRSHSRTHFFLGISGVTFCSQSQFSPGHNHWTKRPNPDRALLISCYVQHKISQTVMCTSICALVKKLLWMQTFLNPLMTAIESGTASADATLLTYISHYCNEQSTGSGKQAADRDLLSCNCYLLLIKHYCTDKFWPQTLCKHTNTCRLTKGTNCATFNSN